jgi:membrane protein implicated in regulation of membrane protease activity
LKSRSGRWHTIYSIISTLLEEAGIVLLMVVVLPVFGINVPLWGTAAVVLGFAVFSYIMYRIGHPTVLFEAVTEPGAIVGKDGVVEVDFNPAGYVRVEGELWKAFASSGADLRKGDVVVVTRIKGLELTVERKAVLPLD